MGSLQESAPKLPQPHLTSITEGISLLNPLSRKGQGPGIIVLVHEDSPSEPHDSTSIKDGVPSPAMKWAEEGYVVAEVRESAFQASKDPFVTAIDAIFKRETCDQKSTVGLVAYSPKLWNLTTPLLKSHAEIVAAVIYADIASQGDLATAGIPVVQHLAGEPPAGSPGTLPRTKMLTAHSYPSSTSFAFATPSAKDFHYANEAVSHTRSLTFLKKQMDGPWFDLEAIWDEHTYYEFAVRDVTATMNTMLDSPYVNHIPTITGGIGRAKLTDFYTHHFVHGNPPDTELELISRTVGIDRVVDEFIFKFTHTCTIDWLFPGVPPTQKRAEIPFTAIVNIRGDRLYHEHIAWDQATALRQIGLLPEYLPWPKEYAIEGKEGDKTWEYRVPTSGNDTAQKMRDKNGVPSNEMFKFEVREVR